MHARVIELDALADADRTAAHDHDGRLRRLAHLVGLAARKIVVRRARGKLGRGRVDHAEPAAIVDALELAAKERVDPARRITRFDRELDQRRRRIHHRLARFALELAQFVLELHQFFEFPQPEAVDRRTRVDVVDAAVAPQQLADREKPVVRRLVDGAPEFLIAPLGERAAGQRFELQVESANRFHQRGCEGAADAHRLAGRFHLRTEAKIGQRKLVERPARKLHDAVVEGRFVGRFGDAGNGIRNLVERLAERDQRRDLRNRVARRFGCQRRGTRNARVDLDDLIFAAVGMQRELDVAAALHVERADDVDARGAQHLVVEVAERLRGRDDDRIAGVHADRVDVLHVADDDAIVGFVAEHFVLQLFPAQQRRFDQRLIDDRRRETGCKRRAQFGFIVHEAAAGTAERVCRADDQRVVVLGGERDAGLDVGDHDARRHRLADLDHLGLEPFAIFSELDRVERRPEEFDRVALEDARRRKFNRHVQAGLAAERGQQPIGAFARDDRLDRLDRQGLEVHRIGDLGIGHDRRRVRVDEHDAVAFVAKGTARLNTGVVELGGLTDDDRTRADYED